MRPASSLGVLLVAVLVLAGCGGTPEPSKAQPEVAAPLQAPDACDLLSGATLADVVGPSLPVDRGGVGSAEKTSTECGWTFDVLTYGQANVRRPYKRDLSIEAASAKGDPCAEVPEGTVVAGLGTKAAIAWTDAGAVLTFCRSGGFAKVTWSAQDSQAGKKISPTKAEDADTLERLGREVDKRWESARRATPTGFRLPKRGPEPKIPPACGLVPGDTLIAVRVGQGVRPKNNLASCRWALPREAGPTPGAPTYRLLEVDVVSYREGDFSGWEQASNSARQFSHAYRAAPDPELGGGSVVTEPGSSRGRGAKGAFAVVVSLKATNFGGTDARPSPTTAELSDLTRKVLTDALAALPQ